MTTALDGRQRLLAVGADHFLETGFAETSLRAIAEDAGMKAGSIYYHFDSKDELLSEILRIGMTAVTDALDTALESSTGLEPAERLRRAIAAHLEALFAHGPFTAAHVKVFGRAPQPVKDEIVPLRDGYESMWNDLFEWMAGAEALRPDVDIHLARLTLLGAMNSSLEWFDPAGDQPLTDLIDAIADQHWRGIAADSREDA